MMETGRLYALPGGASFKVIENPHENGGGRVVFERVMSPRKGRVDPHYHLDCDQDYEFLEGSSTMEIDGERREFRPGETASVPKGTPHRDPFNRSDEQIRFRATITPSPAFITAYGDALAERFATGRLNRQEELPLLEILAITHSTGGQSYRAGIPRGLQRAMLPAAAALARLRD